MVWCCIIKGCVCVLIGGEGGKCVEGWVENIICCGYLLLLFCEVICCYLGLERLFGLCGILGFIVVG